MSPEGDVAGWKKTLFKEDKTSLAIIISHARKNRIVRYSRTFEQYLHSSAKHSTGEQGIYSVETYMESQDIELT